MDRESVITHLQIIHTWAEFTRKRDLQFFTKKHLEDIAQWADDAIALLKEQEVKRQISDEIHETAKQFRQTIVRCKDCVHADDFDCPAPLPTGYLCQKGHGSHTGDWFCADGRKENDKERGISST